MLSETMVYANDGGTSGMMLQFVSENGISLVAINAGSEGIYGMIMDLNETLITDGTYSVTITEKNSPVGVWGGSMSFARSSGYDITFYFADDDTPIELSIDEDTNYKLTAVINDERREVIGKFIAGVEDEAQVYTLGVLEDDNISFQYYPNGSDTGDYTVTRVVVTDEGISIINGIVLLTLAE